MLGRVAILSRRKPPNSTVSLAVPGIPCNTDATHDTGCVRLQFTHSGQSKMSDSDPINAAGATSFESVFRLIT